MRRLWQAFWRFFFRLLYNEFAWTYDLVAKIVSLGQWKDWGITTIKHLEGKRVLELAHGPGHLLKAMAEPDRAPVGIDLSPYMGRLAQRRLGSVAPLVRARAQALPFCDECFDSAVSTFPTEFILAPAVWREAARVLRSNGRLVIIAWAGLGGRDPLSRLIMLLYRVTGQGKSSLDMGAEAAARAGFTLHVVREQVGRSEVMLVVAQKAQ